MKQKLLLLISITLVVIDILIAVLFLSKYAYYVDQVDKASIGIFVGVLLAVEAVITIICITKSQENLIYKLIITFAVLFVIGSFTYKIYNDSVHYELEYEDIKSVKIEDKQFDEDEIKKIVELFNNAKYIKRNPGCQMEGTPDRTLVIELSNDKRISINTFGEQLAVQVSGRSYENSCYWMEQKEINELFDL